MTPNLNDIAGVILSAGQVHPSLQQLFGNQASGMVPINGRPCIFYLLDRLIEYKIPKVYIAVGYAKDNLTRKVQRFYKNKINLVYVEVDSTQGPGNSLLSVLNKMDEKKALVMLGDSIVNFDEKSFQDDSIIWVSDDFNEPEKWCLIEGKHNLVKEIYDKEKVSIENKFVVTGLYFLKDISFFKTFLENGEHLEISHLLQAYLKENKISYILTDHWIDVGHIEKYQLAKCSLLQARYFNSLSYDRLLGTIRKESKEKDKFRNEIKWYLNLPSKLKILSPRIVEYDLIGRKPFVTMEYYGYPSVSELWLFGELSLEIHKSIIKRLFEILTLFRNETKYVPFSDYESIYYDKTLSRLNSLRKNLFWDKLFSYDYITINGQMYHGWPKLIPSLKEKIRNLYREDHNCLLHGDFCFANILYDLNSGAVKLLDPRGNWGDSEGGDIKYDIAKLRHSICGNYDYITNDFFTLTQEKNSFNFQTEKSPAHDSAAQFFDNFIANEFDINQIKLIEGLLFISMLPLHQDKPQRQLAMFSNGIQLLSEVL